MIKINNMEIADAQKLIPRGFIISPPKDNLYQVTSFVELCKVRHNGFCRLFLDKPFVPRTTGPKSQNNAIWGYADQISDHTGQGKTDIVELAKSRAVDKGLLRQRKNKAGELMVNVWGYPVGISLTETSAEEAFCIIQELVDLAKSLDIVLINDKEE